MEMSNLYYVSDHHLIINKHSKKSSFEFIYIYNSSLGLKFKLELKLEGMVWLIFKSSRAVLKFCSFLIEPNSSFGYEGSIDLELSFEPKYFESSQPRALSYSA